MQQESHMEQKLHPAPHPYRHRALLAITGVVTLALVAAGGYGFVNAQQERQERQQALEEQASVAEFAASLDGLRTIAPASRSRAVLTTERVTVPFETVTKNTRTLLKGTSKVVQEGSDGLIIRRWKVNSVDGQDTDRILATERVVREAVSRIVHVGIAVPPPPTPTVQPSPQRESIAAGGTTTLAPRTTSPAPRQTQSGAWPAVPGAEGLNWAAVARCESSGNPTAVNPAGPYYGLYQFLASTWRSVGGSGLPHQASSAEQTYRAKLLYVRSGAGQWPTCGRLL
jgi:resuscitation-promoting factor RpfB